MNRDDARHILEEVEAVADTVLLVVNGKLAAAGDHHGIRAALDDRPYPVRVITNAPDGRQPDAPRGRRLGASRRRRRSSRLLSCNVSAVQRTLPALAAEPRPRRPNTRTHLTC